MKLLPFIGALLLSTAPVQACEELDEVCITSDVALKLCAGMLCKLHEKGVKISEKFDTECNEIKLRIKHAETRWKIYLMGLWSKGTELALECYPNCAINP